MKEYDYGHQGNRPRPMDPTSYRPVFRKQEYNTPDQRRERTQHRANGTWVGPIQRRRDGSKYYKLHHSGPAFGSTSEVDVRRARRSP